MRVLFWGTYVTGAGYPVNRYLIDGLRRAGAQVEERRAEVWRGFVHEALAGSGAQRLVRLASRYARAWVWLAWSGRRAGDHDWVVVGYPGYLDVLVVRFLAALRFWTVRRPVALVAFISLHDTVVGDRGQIRAGSWRAALLRALDRRAFAAADLVLTDTQQAAQYYAGACGLPLQRFRRSFVGHEFAEGEDGPGPPPPCGPPEAPCRVLFFGTYVPLHGVEFVLDAAAHLRHEARLEWVLIGRGQLYPQLRHRAEALDLAQVSFVDRWLDARELAEQVRRAHICLGIFGDTEKAGRVIPFKVFGALALGRPVVTRDSDAARELLVDGESALLVPPANGEALAAAVLRLSGDQQAAAAMAARGHEVYRQAASPRAVGQALLEALEGWSGG